VNRKAHGEAGGLPPGADSTRVTEGHRDGSIEVFDLSAAGAQGPHLRQGDSVEVPPRSQY
jgi:hypothetical protein